MEQLELYYSQCCGPFYIIPSQVLSLLSLGSEPRVNHVPSQYPSDLSYIRTLDCASGGSFTSIEAIYTPDNSIHDDLNASYIMNRPVPQKVS